MPCSDGPALDRIYSEAQRRAEARANRAEAIACALLTAAKKAKCFNVLLNNLDVEEAGTNGLAIQQWWEAHQEQDRIRRAQETQERDRLERIATLRHRIEAAGLTMKDIQEVLNHA